MKNYEIDVSRARIHQSKNIHTDSTISVFSLYAKIPSEIFSESVESIGSRVCSITAELSTQIREFTHPVSILIDLRKVRELS